MHRVRQAHRARPFYPSTLLIAGCLFGFLFIPMMNASAATLRDNAKGGDCASFGVWDVGIKTCALTRDVYDSILIEGNGITLDGRNHALVGNNTGFGVIIESRENNVVRNLTVRNFEFGIYITDSLNNTVTKNIITNNAQTGFILSGSHGTMVTENEISNNATSGLEIFYIMLASQNKVYRNNFINNGYQIFAVFDPNDFFSQPLPLGGNYWSDFDESAEGCHDTNHDKICDSPRMFQYGKDAFPWTMPRGWGSAQNRVPILSFSEEREFISDGIDLNKGTPTTARTFKVVYTDEDNDAPPYVKAIVAADRGRTEYAMSVDTSASEPLRDGNYANGEQYIASKVFPKGEYAYFFEASDARGTLRLPLTDTLNFEAGYSNVAFLPGLEASRLYAVDPNCLFLNCENQLWEPNRNDDVRKLYLSSITGESVNPDIYTKDVIGEVFGVNIYKGFLEYMNKMVADGDVKRFEILPYDWRMDVKSVVNRLVLLKSGGYRMATRIADLASASPTGKVTLITHSNGGLVAKELLEDLKSRGQENLIDQIIMVAAPQLGTPKAILEMLHGATFSFGFPNKEVTRELAENMKSGYLLLPSRTYLDRSPGSLIEFDSNTMVTQQFRTIYGNSISDYDTLRRFLRGENGARTEPSPNTTNEPDVLKEHFLANAETRHAELDAWTPPPWVHIVEIIGWGLDTPRKVKYGLTRKKFCDATACSLIDVIDPQPLVNSEGDGTVVYSSAEALGGERYYVNVKKYNKGFTTNRDHKNILEITPLQTLLTMLIKNETISTLPEFISSTKPPETRDDKRFRVGVHSPVALHLYDSLGRHTGPIPNQNPSSDLELFEELIPNSYYWQVGEGQYSGADGATTTTIELKGKNLGTFTIDIENIVGGVTATTTVYEDIPVTASMTATLRVGESIEPLLKVDIDGDGMIDANITAGGLTIENLVGILKGLVKTLNLPAEKEKKLVERIRKVEKELKKEHNNERVNKQNTEHAFGRIIKIIKKYEKKGVLARDEAVELISIIEQIKENVVK